MARGWLAILLLAAPQDSVKLKWKIPKDHFVRYKAYTWTGDNKTASTQRVAGLFWYEIKDDTRYVAAPRDDRDFPLALCLTVPPRALAVGQSIDLSTEVESMSYGTIRVKGTTTRVKSDEYVQIVHKAKLSCSKAGAMKIEDGAFEATVIFDADLGVARNVKFSWSYTYEVNTQPKPTKYTQTQNEILEFVEILAPRYPKFEPDVDKAIHKGVEAIWKKYKEADAHWDEMGEHKAGPSALALLAILKGTLDRRDPRIRQALDWILKQPIDHTYDVGLSLMVLESYYGTDVKKIEKAHLQWATAAAKWLLQEQNAKGMWHYPMKGFTGSGDYSNTQYGVLGLLAATKLGVPVDLGALQKSLRGYLESQQPKGPKVALSRTEQGPEKKGTKATENAESRGWAYGETAGDYPYGSMTLGGIGSLMILESLLRKSGRGNPNELAKSAMARRDGWAWMQEHWAVKSNANYGGSWYCYYLYALERAAMLNNIQTVGGHDWYYEGAVVLICNQSEDGTWFGSTLYDTCFAVLFLKRATMSVATPTK